MFSIMVVPTDLTRESIGSSPIASSNKDVKNEICPCDGIGRHSGFRNRIPQGSESSSLSEGTRK